MQRFLRNVASNYSVAAVDGALLLIVTPLVVHNLGIAHYSVWIIVQTIGYYLGFLDLGLTEAQIRQHARLKAARNEPALRALLGTVSSLYLLAGIVALALAFAMTALPVGRWLDIEPDLLDLFPLLLLAIGLQNLFSLLNRGINAIYEAEERFAAVNSIHIVVSVCKGVTVCLAMLAEFGLVTLFVIQVVFTAAGYAARLWFLPKLLPMVARPRPKFDRESWAAIRQYTLWNSLNEFMTEGTAHFDKLLIPVVLGSVLVGPYSLVVTLAAVVFVVAEPITNTFLPMFSRVGQSGSTEATRILLARGTRLVLTFTLPVSLIIGFFGDALLDLWIGAEYTPIAPAVLWFTIANFFFSTVLWTPLAALMAAGRIRNIFVVSAGEVILVVVLILLLTPRFGLSGLAFAGLIANVVTGLALFIPMACAEAGMATWRFLWQAVLLPLAAAMPGALVALVLLPRLDLTTWTETLVGACLVGAVTVVTIAALAIPRRERLRYLVTCRQLLGIAA